jgi:predicted dehydrogenase
MTPIVEPPLNDLWTIPGEETMLPQFQAEDRARFMTIDPMVHYHKLQIHDFLCAILDNRQPRVSGEDGRRVVAFVQAIYQSNREGKSARITITE